MKDNSELNLIKNEETQIDNHLAANRKITRVKDVVEWINGLVEEAEKNPGRAWWGGSKSASKGMAGIKNACKELGWNELSQSLKKDNLDVRDAIALEALLTRIKSAASSTKRGRTKTPEFEKSLNESLDVFKKELDEMQKKLDVLNKDAGLKNIIKLQSHVRSFLQRKKEPTVKDIESEANSIQLKTINSINENENISESKKQELIEKSNDIINDELNQTNS